MDQAQKPPSGEKPEPGLQRKDLRKSSQAVRDKIGTALKKSMFVPLFDRMVDGEEESKNVLAVIDLANRGQTNLASELFGLRTRLRNLDAIDANVQVALFLQEAAALIPSLNKALAAEIIIGLEKAADNEAFFQIADAAVDKLLDSPSSLTRPIEKQLRDLRKVIDRKRREHEENRTITRPDGVKSALWQGIRAEPEDDEESGPKRRSETEIEKGARALGIVVCGFAGLIILLMIGSVMGHKDDSNEPAPQPKTEQPISAPVQAPPPQNEEPVPSVTILDVLPSAPKE